jgi:hypothetical protein
MNLKKYLKKNINAGFPRAKFGEFLRQKEFVRDYIRGS